MKSNISCTKIGDLTSSYRKGVTPHYVDHSKTMVLNQKCIRNNSIDFSFAQYLDDNQKIQSEKFVSVGDLLVNSTGQGTAGRVAFVRQLPKDLKVTVDSHILILRFTDPTVSRAVNYSLYSFQDTLQTFLDGSTGQGEFDRVRLFNTTVKYPEDQTLRMKAVSVLELLDEKISINSKINDELQKLTRTVFNYWFVQFDFPGKNGKPYKSSGGEMCYDKSLKRNIPKLWLVKKLSEISDISTNSINPGNYPLKVFKHISIPSFDVNGLYYEEKGDSIKSNKFVVTAENILVSKLNPKFSRVVYATNEADLICSTEFVVWKPVDQKIKPFLFSVATDQSFNTHCIQSASGTSHSHNRINPDVMMSYDLPYDQSTVEKFGELIKPSIERMALNTVETRRLILLRDLLLPLLMSGQVTVK